jgi:hypothetical protein
MFEAALPKPLLISSFVLSRRSIIMKLRHQRFFEPKNPDQGYWNNPGDELKGKNGCHKSGVAELSSKKPVAMTC